jgi:hypothetical protein
VLAAHCGTAAHQDAILLPQRMSKSVGKSRLARRQSLLLAAFDWIIRRH